MVQLVKTNKPQGNSFFGGGGGGGRNNGITLESSARSQYNNLKQIYFARYFKVTVFCAEKVQRRPNILRTVITTFLQLRKHIKYANVAKDPLSQ